MRPREPRPVPAAATPWITTLSDPDEDRRRLRLAAGAALLAHSLLLLVSWPREVPQLPAVEPERPLFVVRRVRFRLPEPPPPAQVVERREAARPIPVPEILIHEPLREVETKLPTPEVELPDLEVVEIPEPREIVEELPQGPIPIAGEVRAPVKLEAPLPRYPELARRSRIQGQVLLQAVIDRQGRVTGLRVLHGLPMGLTEAALEAVERWRFAPATLRGRPVDVYMSLVVDFALR